MNNNIDIDRITQPIIFVIDSTGSNQGYPITIINNMIRNCVDYLEAIDSSSDYAIRIGILKFNTGCEWITKNMLVPPTDIKRLWEDIIPYGYGELDCVLHELNTKLSRQKLLQNQFRICRPLILFITDGAVSSIDEKLLDSIKNLWSNNVYVHSIRLAVCVGDFFNEEVLFKLVGNNNLVEKEEPSDEMIVKVCDYIPSIKTELRYATDNNFTGKKVYSFKEAYLRYGTVKKLKEANTQLNKIG